MAVSRARCIVLSATGERRWRLWQIVRREPSLRELANRSQLGDAECQRYLAQAERMFAEASIELPCSLDTIGLDDTARPIYVALVPRDSRGVS